MSQKELQRIKVVENAVEGRISVAEAAELLQLSDRHVKRLKRSYEAADAPKNTCVVTEKVMQLKSAMLSSLRVR